MEILLCGRNFPTLRRVKVFNRDPNIIYNRFELLTIEISFLFLPYNWHINIYYKFIYANTLYLINEK